MSEVFIKKDDKKNIQLKCSVCGSTVFSKENIQLKELDYGGYNDANYISLECWGCGNTYIFKSNKLEISN